MVLRRALLLTSLVTGLVGCPAGGDDDDAVGDDDDATECSYPDGAVEPMELGEVLTPYSWPSALSFDRTDRELSLERAHCNDDDIDWSPFDVLLFVSYPAW
jgi:hypothetical protein